MQPDKSGKTERSKARSSGATPTGAACADRATGSGTPAPAPPAPPTPAARPTGGADRVGGRRGGDADGTGEARPAPPRGSVVDRRSGLDRRAAAAMLAEEEGESTGLERRRGPGRRRSDFAKAAEEGEMTKEQFLFVMAIDAFKRSNGRMFPTWTDVLEVIRLLGYRKTMPSQLNLQNAEDWLEKPDSPANVRTRPGHREEGERRAA